MNPKVSTRALICAWGAWLFLGAGAARAWDDVGHRVVAAIAWENLTPESRARAVALLSAAPADADLANLLPQDGRPLEARQRELFLKAATWPDIVRDQAVPARFAKYHKGPWHYIGWYWEPTPGTPRDRIDIPADPENVVERLEVFDPVLSDELRAPSERGVELAWVLHLVGDLHQPLHAASRVTSTEPRGDHGGNDFKLDAAGKESLHWFWDSILTKARPRGASESDAAYVDRLAADIARRFPKPDEGTLMSAQYERWTRGSNQTVKTRVYPQSLKRKQPPSSSYRQMALGVSEPAIALAGYRLADTIERIFANAGPALSADEREVARLLREWVAAFITGNGAWLAANLAENSLHTTGDGAALTKEQLIASVTSGGRRMNMVVPDDVRIRVYGDTAVATAHARVQGTAPGPGGTAVQVAGEQRGIQVWVRTGGAWKLVASQVTPVAGAAGGPP